MCELRPLAGQGGAAEPPGKVSGEATVSGRDARRQRAWPGGGEWAPAWGRGGTCLAVGGEGAGRAAGEAGPAA